MRLAWTRRLSLAMAFVACATPFAGAQRATETGVGEGTRITLRLNDYLSTKLSSEGDNFTADVLVAVYQGDKLIIPKGSIVSGRVGRVIRPGRFRGKAEI